VTEIEYTAHALQRMEERGIEKHNNRIIEVDGGLG
jgi:hypothetical protein